MIEKDLDQIEQYLNGNLSIEEMATFEERLKKNKALQKELAETKTLIEGIEYSARKEAKEKLRQLEDSLPPLEFETKTVSFFRKPYLLGIAASIIIIITSIYLFLDNNPSSQSLYTEYFEAYPNIIAPTVRGTENPKDLKEQAYHTYELGKYSEAIPMFQNVSIEEDHGAALLYLGICYMVLEDDQNAISSFISYEDSGFELFLPQVKWYLGLTYLRQGNKEAARQAWGEIPEGNSYRIKSTDILKNY